MGADLAALDATAQAELARRGEVTPAELVDAAIERAEQVNTQIHAVIHPLYEKARERAQAPLPDGPFRGVPFLMKDLVGGNAGEPLHHGMKLLRDLDFRAPEDSYLAARFRDAGLITIGKTNTPEWGLAATTEPEAYGPSRNPWNLEHSTGGSSGGSAAAVAARVVAVGHGGDGGGSLRIPASECGIVGLKASRGRISLGPAQGEAWHGLATEGVMTRTIRDMAGFLDVMAGPMPGDPYGVPAPDAPFAELAVRDPGPLRIGVLAKLPWGRGALHPDCRTAVTGAAELLAGLGHRVEDSHPEAYDEPDFFDHFSRVVHAHAARTLDEIAEGLGRAVGPDAVERYTWHFVEVGRQIRAADYIAAADWLGQFSRRMARFWAGGFDLLLTPTIAEPPPRLGELGGTDADPVKVWERNLEVIPFTPAQNATGQPALSLPLAWNGAGLPIGVQLVADYGREDLLLQVATQVEASQPWSGRVPPIHAT